MATNQITKFRLPTAKILQFTQTGKSVSMPAESEADRVIRTMCPRIYDLLCQHLTPAERTQIAVVLKA